MMIRNSIREYEKDMKTYRPGSTTYITECLLESIQGRTVWHADEVEIWVQLLDAAKRVSGVQVAVYETYLCKGVPLKTHL